ncbi:MAG: putative lipid II flippase FtsW [Christensenellaceae bacterium]|jgi:cell division protein FtsW
MRKGAIDYTLLITTIILIAYGMLMVFSSSYYMAQSSADYDYDGLSLFKKQLVGVAVGAVGMIFFMLFDYKKLLRLKYAALGLAIFTLILVFIPGVGVTINGASRWIRMGPLPNIQPLEIAKLAVIIFTASTIYVNRNRMNTFRYGIVPPFLVLGVVCLLLYLQPNFSGIILLCVVVFIMVLIGGAKGWHMAALGGGVGAAGAALMMSASYRMARVTSFLDPFANMSGDGYQVAQSLFGIGAGGLFGSGLGNGRQKFLWLPYSESDFIFSIICEELGFIGAAVLILLFIILIYRGIRIAAQAPDFFATMLATGIVVMISVQVILNIAVTTASLPATGVSLPFISFGSSSLAIYMCMIGILLNISKQSRRQAAKKVNVKAADADMQEDY